MNRRLAGFALSFSALAIILLLPVLPYHPEKSTTSHRKTSCQLYQFVEEFLATPPAHDVMPVTTPVAACYLPSTPTLHRPTLVNRRTAPRAPPAIS